MTSLGFSPSGKKRVKANEVLKSSVDPRKSTKITDIIEGGVVDKERTEKRNAFIKDSLEGLDDTQLLRFEYFSRAHFPREKIKEIIRSKLGELASSTDLTDEMAIVVGSLAKMFCGDLVETALEVLREQPSHQDGLKKNHISEAVRRMQRNGQISMVSDSYSEIFRVRDDTDYGTDEVDLSTIEPMLQSERKDSESVIDP